jgi:ribosomal protein S21
VQVLVRDNNVDQALKALKKKMQREGIFREMKLRGHYEKPSEKKAREKGEEELRIWASQHLNVEIGLALHNDRWRGADYWLQAKLEGLTLDELLERVALSRRRGVTRRVRASSGRRRRCQCRGANLSAAST